MLPRITGASSSRLGHTAADLATRSELDEARRTLFGHVETIPDNTLLATVERVAGFAVAQMLLIRLVGSSSGSITGVLGTCGVEGTLDASGLLGLALLLALLLSLLPRIEDLLSVSELLGLELGVVGEHELCSTDQIRSWFPRSFLSRVALPTRLVEPLLERLVPLLREEGESVRVRENERAGWGAPCG